MHDPASDFRRLAAALRDQWQIARVDAGLPVLAQLQKALRAGRWQVTAAIRDGRDLVAVWPGLVDRVFGVGKLLIDTAGSSGGAFEFKALLAPTHVREILDAAVRAERHEQDAAV